MSGPPPFSFLYSQLVFTPPKPTQKYTGQTVMVTGSNIGLGLEAARWFVKLDAAKVILAVRTIEKGDEAKKDIEASTKRMGVVEVWSLDLSSYESVKQCAKKAEGLERLDVLVENAGILTWQFKMMEDNESHITTNVVSPLLHAVLSLPKLRETSIKFNTVTKLVFTQSFTHWMAKFNERKEANILESLADEKKADMADRYNVSKLLGMYSVRKFAELETASKKAGKVVINFLNPGWVVTNVIKEYEGLDWLMFVISRSIFARSTEVGSRTIVNAAEAGEDSHGQYLNDCRPGP